MYLTFLNSFLFVDFLRNIPYVNMEQITQTQALKPLNNDNIKKNYPSKTITTALFARAIIATSEAGQIITTSRKYKRLGVYLNI